MGEDSLGISFTIKCSPEKDALLPKSIDIIQAAEKLESEGRFKEAFELIWCFKESGHKNDKLNSRFEFYKLINYNFELVNNLFYYFKTFKKTPKIDFNFISGYLIGSSRQTAFNFDKVKKIISDLKTTQDQKLISFREQLEKWLEEALKIKPVTKLGDRPITETSSDFMNEDIGKLMTITAPSAKDMLDFEITINGERFPMYHQNIKKLMSRNNPLVFEYEIDLSPYMSIIKIGSQFQLRAVTNSSSFKYHPVYVGIFGPDNNKSTLTFTRKIKDVNPISDHYPKNIQQLYSAIAEDIKSGIPFTATLSVILWKNIPPEKNLYWTSGGGVYYYFKRYWKLEEEKDVDTAGGSGKPFKVLVFSKTIKPNKYWKSLGITEPFKIYLMVRAYYWKDIESAYKDYAQNLFDIQDESITLKDGTTISTKKSRVAGLLGHRIEEGWEILERNRKFTLNPPIKGTFIMGCTSGSYFQSYTMQRPNTYGLMFTRDLMFPGAFALQAMLEGMGEGLSGPKLAIRVNESYSTHQKLDHVQRLYINQEESYFKKFEDPYIGDADNDGLENRIDPEPTIPNNYEYIPFGSLPFFDRVKIHLSNNTELSLLIYRDYFQPSSLFISPNSSK